MWRAVAGLPEEDSACAQFASITFVVLKQEAVKMDDDDESKQG